MLTLVWKGFQAILKTQTSDTHFRHLHSELQASCVTYGSLTSIVLSLKKNSDNEDRCEFGDGGFKPSTDLKLF